MLCCDHKADLYNPYPKEYLFSRKPHYPTIAPNEIRGEWQEHRASWKSDCFTGVCSREKIEFSFNGAPSGSIEAKRCPTLCCPGIPCLRQKWISLAADGNLQAAVVLHGGLCCVGENKCGGNYLLVHVPWPVYEGQESSMTMQNPKFDQPVNLYKFARIIGQIGICSGRVRQFLQVKRRVASGEEDWENVYSWDVPRGLIGVGCATDRIMLIKDDPNAPKGACIIERDPMPCTNGCGGVQRMNWSIRTAAGVDPVLMQIVLMCQLVTTALTVETWCKSHS